MGRNKSIYPNTKQYKGPSSAQKKPKKSQMPLLCRVIGIILLFGVMICILPATFPRIAGLEVYHVENDNMEPEIPAGSIAYIRSKAPAEIKIDDVVVFSDGQNIILQRVLENDTSARELTAKDEKASIDEVSRIPYDDIYGIVSSHIPKLGAFLAVCLGFPGRLIMLALALGGTALILLSGRKSAAKN